MTLATSLSTVCDALVSLLETNAEDLGIPVGGVFYGDQSKIPVSPAVCVEPDSKTSELYGAGRMTEVNFRVNILVYHSEIRNIESNRRDADLLAESIATLTHKDPTFGGLVIHCFTSEIQSGYATKDRSVIRTTRLTWTARSQERLPNQGEV
jgi:hypothetical protein